jgi:mannose-6-phosphate isomerase-like protein (cupin superfamily)
MKWPDINLYKPENEYYFTEGCYITELWNTAADPDLSIARARVIPGTATKWHKLEGIAERYVILEGRGKVEVGNLPPGDVGVGDVVAIPADTPQRITNTGSEQLIFLAICTPRFIDVAYKDADY